MDKTKEYKIINTLTTRGEISDKAKHRIGRVGKFIRLTKGMSFEFLYTNMDYSFRSSKVESIEEMDNTIRIRTLNTIYVFKLNEV